jgi:anti-anti-sigma factor
MTVESTQLESAVVVKVTGRMDSENAIQFRETCEDWIRKGMANIVVDLSELNYVSSMGLGCVLGVLKAAQAKKGSVALCSLKGLPKQVFEVTKLIGLFPLYDNTDAALAALA